MSTETTTKKVNPFKIITIFLCVFDVILIGYMFHDAYLHRCELDQHYENACIAIENGNYSYAVQELESIPNIEHFHIQDAQYKLEEARYLYTYYEARNYMDDENWAEAIKYLIPILEYEDCERLYQQCLDGYAADHSH